MSADNMSDLELTSTDPRKKKFSIHFIFFYLLFKKNIFQIQNFEKKKGKERKRKLALTTKRKKKKFKFRISKKKKKHFLDIFFDFIFMSRDRAKPLSHRTEIPSQDHFKIQASESLTRDPRH